MLDHDAPDRRDRRRRSRRPARVRRPPHRRRLAPRPLRRRRVRSRPRARPRCHRPRPTRSARWPSTCSVASTRSSRSTRPPVSDDLLHRIMMFCAGEADRRRLRRPRARRGELRRATTAGASRGTRAARRRRARRVPRRDHRRRPRRALRRHPARAGRDPVHGVREERRRRRHVVREHVPRPARRRAQPLLLVLVRSPIPDWSDYYARRDELAEYIERCAQGLRRARRTSASAPRCRRRVRRRAGGWTLQRPRRATARERGRSECERADQRGRHAQPPVGARPRRARRRSPARAFHSSRWDHDVDAARASASRSSAPARARCSSCPPSRPRSSTSRSSSGRATGSRPTPCTTGAGDRRARSGCSATCRTTPAGTASCMFWNSADRMYPAFRVDPEWPTPDISISRPNDKLRRIMTAHVERELADTPELVDAGAPRLPAARASACCRTTAGSGRCCATTSSS